MRKACGTLSLALCAFFVFGCSGFRLHSRKANDTLYADAKEFGARVEKLKLNSKISEAEFFKVMNIIPNETPELNQLNTEQVAPFVRGCLQPLTSGGMEEAVSKECSLYNGWALPYTHIQPRAFIMPHKFMIEVDTTGHDQKLVAVFRDGKLWKSFLSGKAVIGTVDEYFVWDLLSGVVQSSAEFGAKEGIKAIIP